MDANHKTIQRFYTAFQKLDYATMQDCYADNATFSDAVFLNLNAEETKAMWEMLCKRATDLRITFEVISVDEHSGSAKWKAVYTFNATGRKITNNIHAAFEFTDGKISKHTDCFSFYTWAKQAFGTKGLLLGWLPFFKSKVRSGSRKALRHFMR